MKAALLAALLLAGCTTTNPTAGQVCIDRGEFGYALGSIGQIVETRCAAKGLNASPECVRLLETRDAAIKLLRTPTTAPSGVDMEQIMKLLIGVGKLAL